MYNLESIILNFYFIISNYTLKIQKCTKQNSKNQMSKFAIQNSKSQNSQFKIQNLKLTGQIQKFNIEHFKIVLKQPQE